MCGHFVLGQEGSDGFGDRQLEFVWLTEIGGAILLLAEAQAKECQDGNAGIVVTESEGR